MALIKDRFIALGMELEKWQFKRLEFIYMFFNLRRQIDLYRNRLLFNSLQNLSK